MRTGNLFPKCFVVLMVVGLSTLSARAGSVNLSTGLDGSGNLQTTGNSVDANWTVDLDPLTSGTASAKVVDSTNADWWSGWLANGPNSSWITRDPNTNHNGTPIPYSYYRSFTLTSADLATASISGSWSIDDSGTLNLNGNNIDSLSAGNWGALHSFSVAVGSSFFHVGVNTLTITMTGSDNDREAVRLEGSLTGVNPPSSAPEPSTILTALAGGVALFFARKKIAR